MTERYETDMAQDEAEITAFCALLQREQVKSYLEIGSKFGGSLWRVANALPKGSRIVAVDMPHATIKWRHSEPSLRACAQELTRRGYEVNLVWGDSTAAQTISEVAGLGPFDAVFIDANHTTPYVTADWNNYGPMGRVVAFHDIAWKPRPGKPGIDVPEFWKVVSVDYRHVEFKLDPTGGNCGIGVLWR